MMFGDGNLRETERLAALARNGDQHAFDTLLECFNAVIISKASSFLEPGLDIDDLIQECALGLLDAVNSYSREGTASFKTYASVCMENRLISASRSARRRKNAPLADYIQIHETDMPAPGNDEPEHVVLSKEGIDIIRNNIASLLSDTEKKALNYYLSGYSYSEIADRLGLTEKAVDNAIQRSRRKLRKTIGEQ